jgi:predicted dinucleotide-binding enzyme
MKIAILGSRRVGTGLGALWARSGHAVVAGSCRGNARLAPVFPIEAHFECAPPAEAVEGAEVVLLAAAPAHLAGYLGAVGPLAGRVVIDAYDMHERGPDGSPMDQYLARMLPGARIVKAFDTVRWYFEDRSIVEGPFGPSRVPLSGGDGAARAIVTRLVEDLGLAPRDLGARADGSQRSAVHLEAITA